MKETCGQNHSHGLETGENEILLARHPMGRLRTLETGENKNKETGENER
jgi:hypothetical protein